MSKTFAAFALALSVVATPAIAADAARTGQGDHQVAEVAKGGAPADEGNFGWEPANELQAQGREVFRNCRACHSMNPALNTFGPSLKGVYMREAASLPRFMYSNALKASGITWDDASLKAWISGNTSYVADTRMRHIAIQDPAEQKALLEFLKSFK
ncbi:MAG: c-type cytochrome [Magnetovibrionaceae bacterium]